jgi:DNA-binding NarL/FixJ family response regulator
MGGSGTSNGHGERGKSPIRVAIVVGSATVRRELRERLNRAEDIEVVATFEGEQEFRTTMETTRQIQADIVLIDSVYPVDPVVIYFTTSRENRGPSRAAKSNFSGGRLTDMPLELLIRNVREAGKTGDGSDPNDASTVPAPLTGQRTVPRSFQPKIRRPLSKREGEVAMLAARGLQNREIATRLRLKEQTVRNYLYQVYRKLGISDRVELAIQFLGQRANDAGQEPARDLPSSAGADSLT